MTQSQPLRLQAKWANRVVGWLLAVPVGFLWLLAITFAFLSLVALSQIGVKEPMDLFGFGAFALVIGLICLLASLLTGKLHDALAVYEFTPQDVSKRSPFREQRANWSEVAGWAIAESDGIWWLLDTKGRVLLSLEWHTLPEEQVPAAKAFVVDHLGRSFLAMPTAAQPSLPRLRRFHRLRFVRSIVNSCELHRILACPKGGERFPRCDGGGGVSHGCLACWRRRLLGVRSGEIPRVR